MIEIIKKILAAEHINRRAIRHNPLLSLMYRGAYPFAMLLNKLGLSANQITTLSLVFGVFSFFSLAFHDSVWLFCIFWALTVLFDFCDGTVARMSDTVRQMAFRYDHISDMFKIFLVFLATGIRYDDIIVWCVSTSSCFLFMYYSVVHHDSNSHRKIKLLTAAEKEPVAPEQTPNDEDSLKRKLLGHLPFLQGIYRSLRSVFLYINGHSLLIFFLAPLGKYFAIGAYTYFGALALLGLHKSAKMLISEPKL